MPNLKLAKIVIFSVILLQVVFIKYAFGQTDNSTQNSTEVTLDIETTTSLTNETMNDPEDDDDSLEVPDKIAKHLMENLTIVVVEKSWETPGQLPLPENYDKNDIPRAHGDLPLKVAVFVNIRGINQVDMKNEKITLDLDFYTFWADPRFHSVDNETKHHKNSAKKELAVEVVKLSPDFVDTIWTPDVIIENAVVIPHHDQTSEPIVSFNTETGFVMYNRMEVQSSCAMIFCYYPLDIQNCEFSFKSHKYLNEHLELHWMQHGGGGVFLDHPHNPNFEIKVDSATRDERIAKSLHFPNLLSKVHIGKISWTDKSFDVVKFVLSFRRNLSFHMVQTYSPSMFFIGITWLCFLLPPGMHASRVGITMTTLLTINTMFNSVRAASPQVSYATALDVWMIACIVYAFLTLLQFTLMSWLDHAKEREEKHAKEKEEEDQKVIEAEFNKMDGPLELKPKPAKYIKMMNPVKLRALLVLRKFLKRFGLLFLSMSFITFNTVYWAYLCLASEYYSWEVDPMFNAL